VNELKHRTQHRVTLIDLIRGGHLVEGQRFSHQQHQVVVVPGGLQVVGGQIYEAPTPAAESVNGGKAVNGWTYWRSPSGDLDSFRQKHPGY